MITAITGRWALCCDACRRAYTYPPGPLLDRALDQAATDGWTRTAGIDRCPICSGSTIERTPRRGQNL